MPHIFDVEIERGMLHFVLANVGAAPAHAVRVKLDKAVRDLAGQRVVDAARDGEQEGVVAAEDDRDASRFDRVDDGIGAGAKGGVDVVRQDLGIPPGR